MNFDFDDGDTTYEIRAFISIDVDKGDPSVGLYGDVATLETFEVFSCTPTHPEPSIFYDKVEAEVSDNLDWYIEHRGE